MRIVLFSFLLMLVIAAPVRAMTVWPTVIDLSTIGRDGQAQINVMSSEAVVFPVEIDVQTLEIAENGSQTLAPADDEFLIFPPQAMIQPGATQVFRIQWVGDPELQASRSFLIRVNQVPIQSADGASMVQMIYSFAIMVNVADPANRSELAVAEVVPVHESEQSGVTLLLENTGDRHDYLSSHALTLSGDGWSTTLTPDQLAQIIGIGVVQPGRTRRFTIPLDLPATVRTLAASLAASASR